MRISSAPTGISEPTASASVIATTADDPELASYLRIEERELKAAETDRGRLFDGWFRRTLNPQAVGFERRLK